MDEKSSSSKHDGVNQPNPKEKGGTKPKVTTTVASDKTDSQAQKVIFVDPADTAPETSSGPEEHLGESGEIVDLRGDYQLIPSLQERRAKERQIQARANGRRLFFR